MFVVNSLPVAIIFCVITMLGWGSWANTQKLAGKEKWPFELFYWDYAIGVFLFSLVLAHTLGSFGLAGAPTRENLHQANWSFVLPALISGVLFNLSNILLVVGIDAAGMSAVSYTHLRAHETRHDLVCRLLLEKKKKTPNNVTSSYEISPYDDENDKS